MIVYTEICFADRSVDPSGLEPLTSAVQMQCSTSWTTGPEQSIWIKQYNRNSFHFADLGMTPSRIQKLCSGRALFA